MTLAGGTLPREPRLQDPGSPRFKQACIIICMIAGDHLAHAVMLWQRETMFTASNRRSFVHCAALENNVLVVYAVASVGVGLLQQANENMERVMNGCDMCGVQEE